MKIRLYSAVGQRAISSLFFPTICVVVICVVVICFFLPKAPQVHVRYSSLVVFGDSYSDPIYSGLGNRSAGVHWPNPLVKILSTNTKVRVKLYDYAYNGAHSNSNLTHFGQKIPDTRSQLNMYLEDLKAGKVENPSQGVLHVIWIGINPVDAIWMEACDPNANNGSGAGSPTDPPFLRATRRVNLQVEEVRSQLEKLRTNTNKLSATSLSFPSSYMIVTVPNLTVAPLQNDSVRDWVKGDNDKGKMVMSLLGLLIEQYNEGLRSTVSDIQGADDEQCKFVGLYDITTLWNGFITHPKKYGIKYVYERCYENDVACSNVDEHLFWDYIHPIPRIHKIIAQDMYSFLISKYQHPTHISTWRLVAQPGQARAGVMHALDPLFNRLSEPLGYQIRLRLP